MSLVDETEDLPSLCPETFLALQQFYNEQEAKEEKLKLAVEKDTIDDIEIEEDWQLSQFWYDDATIDYLVEVALKSVGKKGKIALISCPSLYKKMKRDKLEQQEITLYEFDKRFSVFGDDYKYYDYNYPLDLGDKSKYFDLVIVDPPFLSEECLKKNFITMRFLAKDKIILCTGAKMSDLVESMHLQRTDFIPRHKNNLANDFCCFANYDINSVLK